ncbi:unnamed protein product [Adineta ricciae]|uniref:Uncharacterized protein n=1 Tax=Adineta ricciae TaxID=249248 RepID=A0A814DF36_ADIRI|nr:unnamed protein product [Adineta ricciae]
MQSLSVVMLSLIHQLLHDGKVEEDKEALKSQTNGSINSTNAKEGFIVAGGNNPNQLDYPQGLFVDQWNQIYVVDSHNDQIVRWGEGDEKGKVVVGGYRNGGQRNQFNDPNDLSMDREGNLYISDTES